MEENKFEYKGIEFIPRNRTFEVQKKANKLIRKYLAEETESIGIDKQREYTSLAVKGASLSETLKDVSEEPEKYSDEDKIKIAEEFVKFSSNSAFDANEYYALQCLAQENFIYDIENAKELMQIMFENENQMIYETTDDELELYVEFMLKVLKSFFFKFKKKADSVI